MLQLVQPTFQSPPDRRGEALAKLGAPVLILDSTGAIQYANSLALELFTKVDLIGLTIAELCQTYAVTLTGRSAESGQKIVSQQDRLLFGDGRIFDITTTPQGNDGDILLLNDVTAYVSDAERALTDSLTGLSNRTAFKRRLFSLLGDARRADQAMAILCVDLDRFKAVNDSLGHPIGDLLLQKVAQRLKSAVREGDVVARLGGDEFAVLQRDAADPSAVKALAARLVDLIGRTYVVDGHMLNIGASVGITLLPADGVEPDVLLKQADLALYRAKAEGRGTYRFFELAMDARMQARRLLEIDLRRAMALKEFTLAYQPQVAIDSREIVGFEALLRWKQPERGMVSPADFIPLAEEIGIINQIGDWVLRTACREAAGWSAPLTIAVNISPVQFRSGKLVEIVTSSLAQSGLAPSRLELEITEGALLEDTSNVLETLNNLRGLGVLISMDDFGTGYSSLSYLQKFPFNKIKIDQSFVRGPDAGDASNAIIRAISSLGISLGMKTIAEGVETDEQLARIRAEGCLEVQGYLTGRPIPADAIPSLLKTKPETF